MTKIEQVMTPYFRRIEQAVFGIAPERNYELVTTVFKRERWELEIVNGSPVAGVNPFTAFPAERKIRVTYSGLAMVWCLAVYAALTLDVVRSAEGKLGGITDVGPIFGRFQKYLHYATQLRTHAVEWPSDLFEPEEGQAGEPYQTIDRIFYGAASWILLHEVAHIHYTHKADLLPIESIRQEVDADEFSARWIFDQVGSEAEREFRILAVGVALAWLLLFEPHGGDSNHPPAATRVMHVASHFDADKGSIALEVIAHLFKILFFPTVPPPEFGTSNELFEWAIGLFRG